MPIRWNEIKSRALTFSRTWADAADEYGRGKEPWKIDEHVAHQRSFSFETTLSGRGYAAKLPLWRANGYRVSLYFLSLPHADMAVERVRLRVSQGGHNIPESVIRRRFESGLEHFHNLYKPVVNAWFLYDNQYRQSTLLAQGVNI